MVAGLGVPIFRVFTVFVHFHECKLILYFVYAKCCHPFKIKSLLTYYLLTP